MIMGLYESKSNTAYMASLTISKLINAFELKITGRRLHKGTFCSYLYTGVRTDVRASPRGVPRGKGCRKCFDRHQEQQTNRPDSGRIRVTRGGDGEGGRED